MSTYEELREVEVNCYEAVLFSLLSVLVKLNVNGFIYRIAGTISDKDDLVIRQKYAYGSK